MRGNRVSLRPLADADGPAIEGWFGRPLGLTPSAAADKLDKLTGEAAADPARWVLGISDGGGPPLGLVAFRAPWPSDGWLTFDTVVLDPHARGRGLALEAVVVVEREAHRLGLARAFTAPVTAELGRALYFWLRLGYRPLLRSSWPWPHPADAGFDRLSPVDLWMIRDGP